jgi:hypothetical protein
VPLSIEREKSEEEAKKEQGNGQTQKKKLCSQKRGFKFTGGSKHSVRQVLHRALA